MKVIIIKGKRINLSNVRSWQVINSILYFEYCKNGNEDIMVTFETEQEAIDTLKKIDLIVGATDLRKMKI